MSGDSTADLTVSFRNETLSIIQEPAISDTSLPSIVAGPILRHVTERSVTVWLITSRDNPARLSVTDDVLLSGSSESQQIQVGKNAFIQLVTLELEKPLTPGGRYEYGIRFDNEQINTQWEQEQSALLYDDDARLAKAVEKLDVNGRRRRGRLEHDKTRLKVGGRRREG